MPLSDENPEIDGRCDISGVRIDVGDEALDDMKNRYSPDMIPAYSRSSAV